MVNERLRPIYRIPASGMPPGGFIGALHCHTTASDGCKTLIEMIDIYRSLGYSFLCVTDHQSAAPGQESPHDDFMLINGVEVATRHGGKVMHIVALDVNDMRFGLFVNLRKLTTETLPAGAITFAAHPHWSDLTATDMAGHGFTGIEIYNYGCRRETGKGNALPYWDRLLSTGENLLGYATDDSHGLDRLRDWGGGWVGVFAPRLEKRPILNALRSGNFYSSMGPKIFDIHARRGKLTVKTSRVIIARLVSRNGYSLIRLSGQAIENGDAMTFEFPLPSRRELENKFGYVRFECEDEETGRLAWSNPIYPPITPKERSK